MKILINLLIVGLMTFLTACNEIEPLYSENELESNGATIEKMSNLTAELSESQIKHNVLYYDTSIYGGIVSSKTITSAKECEDYYEEFYAATPKLEINDENRFCIAIDYDPNDEFIAIKDIFDSYNEEFFTDNVLLVYSYCSSAESIKYTPKSIERGENGYFINAVQELPCLCRKPLGGGIWFVGIGREYYNGSDIEIKVYKEVYEEPEYIPSTETAPPPTTTQAVPKVIVDLPQSQVKYNNLNYYYDGNEKETYKTITSVKERDDYYKTFSDLTLRIGLTEDTSIKDTLYGYDEEFFENNVLVIYTYSERSGSIKHTPKTIESHGENSYSINLEIYYPIERTRDMAGGMIFMAVDKKYYNGLNMPIGTYKVYEADD